MTSVNTNVGAMVALRNLQSTNMSLEQTQDRVSTGLKVIGPKDDASNFSIAQGLRADLYASVENSATEAAPYWCCGRRKTRPVVRLVPLGIGQDVCRGSVRRRSPVRIFGWS